MPEPLGPRNWGQGARPGSAPGLRRGSRSRWHGRLGNLAGLRRGSRPHPRARRATVSPPVSTISPLDHCRLVPGSRNGLRSPSRRTVRPPRGARATGGPVKRSSPRIGIALEVARPQHPVLGHDPYPPLRRLVPVAPGELLPGLLGEFGRRHSRARGPLPEEGGDVFRVPARPPRAAASASSSKFPFSRMARSSSSSSCRDAPEPTVPRHPAPRGRAGRRRPRGGRNRRGPAEGRHLVEAVFDVEGRPRHRPGAGRRPVVPGPRRRTARWRRSGWEHPRRRRRRGSSSMRRDVPFPGGATEGLALILLGDRGGCAEQHERCQQDSLGFHAGPSLRFLPPREAAEPIAGGSPWLFRPPLSPPGRNMLVTMAPVRRDRRRLSGFEAASVPEAHRAPHALRGPRRHSRAESPWTLRAGRGSTPGCSGSPARRR